MPLPPLDPDNTPRGAVAYTSGGIGHLMEWRMPIGSTVEQMETKAQDLANLLAPFMAIGDSATGAFRWVAGSNISIPVTITPVAGTATAPTRTDQTDAACISYTGRSTDGRKVRITIFSQIFDAVKTTRFPLAGAPSVYQDFMDELESNDTPTATISGAVPLWKQYVNVRRNSYWQNQGRLT